MTRKEQLIESIDEAIKENKAVDLHGYRFDNFTNKYYRNSDLYNLRLTIINRYDDNLRCISLDKRYFSKITGWEVI